MTETAGGGKCRGVGVPEREGARKPPPASADRRLQAVHPAAPELERVYREHADFVVRTCRYLRVPEPHVEDVLHDVFLIAHRRLPEYDGRAPLKSWLYGVTRRVVMHHQRRARRTAERERRAPDPAPPRTPDEDLVRRRSAARVEACLAELAPAQRAVFALAEIEGMTAPEIASALGIKLNTVYSRLRLARRRFERALAQRGGQRGAG